MTFGVKPALEEEIESLENNIPTQYRSDFTKIKQANLEFLSNGHSIDNFIVRERFVRFFERIYDAELKNNLEDQAAHIDRIIDLLFFFNVFLKSERISLGEKNILKHKTHNLRVRLEKCIWWFGEKGKLEDLEILYEKGPKIREEGIAIKILQSEQKIVDRDLKDLLEFFNLNSEEFLQSIENTIVECESVEHPDFKKLFDAKGPNRVIEVYFEIRDILKTSYSLEDVNVWLNVPNKIFEGNTPKEYLIKGKVFQVLYFLIKMEWN
jgi:hypothetical protein